MADRGDLQQEILQKTLQEVKQGCENDSNPCVICLEQVSEPAQATPCGHQNFDFLCLTSWLERQAACPLCKNEVKSVLYGFEEQGSLKEYTVTTGTDGHRQVNDCHISSRQNSSHPSLLLRERRRPRRQRRPLTPVLDDGVARRRYVYKHHLFSCRVGSNRLSQYRELSPHMFSTDATLVQRARRWIRRELRVFSFLYPETENSMTADPDSTSGHGAAQEEENRDRRSSNAEFLLDYIISILRTIDIKAASGAAEDLLQEFLGRDHARLFLHELQAFLRSPYTTLRDWDAAVQYDEPAIMAEQRRGRSSETRSTRKGPDDIYPDSYIPNYDDDVDLERRRKRRKVR